jgi:DNA repair protein RadC
MEAAMQYQLETNGTYRFTGPVDESTILSIAEQIREARFYRQTMLSDPRATREYLIAKLALLEHEVFAAVFLDNRHAVIAFDILFTGSIAGASVHPREVVKHALRHNAAAVIFAHNHPSGVPEPSHADRDITTQLKLALSYVDVRVLDHVIVGGNQATSMAERGLI